MAADSHITQAESQTQVYGATNHAAITSLIKQFSGQARILTIPRIYIDMLGGDHIAALFLSQVVFLSDRAADGSGWFAKSYADWRDELGLSERQVRRIAQALTGFGLETALRRSAGHEMAATLHYRLDMNVLTTAILEMCGTRSDETSERRSDETSERSYIESKEESIAPPHASNYEPPEVRLLNNDTLTQANGYTLVQAYSEVTGIPGETLWQSARKTAAGLIRAGVTPQDVTEFLTEMKRTPERYNGYRFNYMAEDLPRWKQRHEAAPAKPAGFWGRDFTDGE